MLARFPDKPILSSHMVLPSLKPGEWIAEMKLDGWRCIIEIGEKGCTFTTRHNKPCPVSGNVAKATYDRLRHLPIGTLLDSEWLERRAGDTERFWIFDVMRIGPEWATGGAKARFEWLASWGMVPFDLIVRHTYADYSAFFEQSKADPTTEGIVLKRCDSKYIGSTRGCAIHPQHFKIKWREGSDGQSRVA